MRYRTGCFAVVGAAFGLLGVLAALNWDMATFVAGALFYRDHGPPPIAQGLAIGDSADRGGGRMAQIVEERLRSKFPSGTDESELRQFLQQQGFKPLANFIPADHRRPSDWKTLVYYWGKQGPACTSDLAVEWKSGTDRRIEHIDVRYNYGCM